MFARPEISKTVTVEKNSVPMPQILTWPPISGSIWAPERVLGSRGYLVNPSGLGRVNSGIHNSVHIQLVLEARRSFNCLHNISCPGSCWGDRSTSLKAQGERRPRSMLPGVVMEINKRKYLCGLSTAHLQGPKAPAEDSVPQMTWFLLALPLSQHNREWMKGSQWL